MTSSTTPPRPNNRRLLQAGLLLALLLAIAARALPDNKLHVIFFATKGDAALVQTPAGRFVLIDGGADPAALAAALGRRLPFWRRTLDAVVLTVPDHARLPGQVAALARYRADVAIAGPAARASATRAEWLRLLQQAGTPVKHVAPGAQFQIDGVTFRVLALGDGAETGVMLRLDYGATSVVFDHSGDEGDEQELAAAGKLRPATLVVFPWQRDPHTPFLAALAPQAIVLTDGFAADKPLEETLAERAAAGTRLLHEQLHGEIEWISDGRATSIRTADA